MMTKVLGFVLLLASACTMGVEQDFTLMPGTGVTDRGDDVWFELENDGGNAPEELRFYRVEIGDAALAGGWYGCTGSGEAAIELVQDDATPDVVDPGDVLRVREYSDGVNLLASENGQDMWINVMVLDLNQRSSKAPTCIWNGVWSSQWHVGT